MGSFAWTCPFCKKPTTIVDDNCHGAQTDYCVKDRHAHIRLGSLFILCPNEECNEYTLTAHLARTVYNTNGGLKIKEILKRWELVPSSKAKPYPKDIVPKALVEDYTEACKIKDLSPKASATLSRRCLQGMIRNFLEVNTKSKGLKDEINVIKDKVIPIPLNNYGF